MPFCDSPCTILNLYESKQCALICADELIEYTDWQEVNYWIEVKQEIQKL
jgi:flagellin-specific chaperone FliS